ncbi:MAG: leucine-rich repeat domain-containing protein [Clostridia bacterium]|nr:leucine-rich repeat domain-containing protein [Clostridia bacterium]
MNIKAKILLFFFIAVFSVMTASCTNFAEKIFEPKYIEINGEEISKDTTELNLKGEGIMDIEPLLQLELLKKLDVRNNPLTELQIENFRQAMPDCEVLWTIAINGAEYDNIVDEVDFTGEGLLDYKELNEKLKYFDKLNEVRIDSGQISADNYKELKNAYPDINFILSISICGLVMDEYQDTIDLSECADINQNDICEALAYFDNPKEVIFADALGDEQPDEQLIASFPDTVFNWNITLGNNVYKSTTTDIDYSEIQVEDFDLFKEQIANFPSLEYIDMCYSGLANEQMEELIEMYPNTKFVWMIIAGPWTMRTDIKAFGTCYREEFEGGKWIGRGYYFENGEEENLKYCTDMEVLDLGHQWWIEDWSFLTNMPKLTHLIIALSYFRDSYLLESLENLEYLEIFNTNISDLSFLTGLPNLKYLNASNILIHSTEYLVDMDSLEWLWFCSQNYITEEEIDQLKEALPDCRIESDAHGSTRNGWRSYENEGYVKMREALNMPLAFWEDDQN